MRLFRRVCQIDVSPDISISGLKIKFDILKHIESEQNHAKIEIYNLSEQTRSQLTDNQDRVVRISAGYEEDLGLIEIGQGTISNVVHVKSPPEIITSIYVKDGFSSTRSNIVSLSFKENIRVGAIVDSISEQINLPKGIINLASNLRVQGGFSYLGHVSGALEQLSKQFNFNWSIQNGTIQILKQGTSTDRDIVNISYESGLIEEPEELIENPEDSKTREYKIVTLLRPQLQVGNKVNIKSADLEGVFTIREISHTGDTRDNEWYTTLRVTQGE